MNEIVRICNDYLEERIDEAEMMRRLVPAINDGLWHEEVAQCLADYLKPR